MEGAPGTGKTTLGLEFIYRGITEFDEPGLVISFEVTPEKLIRDAAAFGWDFPELESQKKLKIISTTRQVFAQEIQQPDSLVLAEAAEIGARRIFLDSLRWPLTLEPDRAESFRVLAHGLERDGLTAMLAMDLSEPTQSTLLTPEAFIADTIVLVGMQHIRRGTQRSIEILKSRGQDYLLGTHSFDIVKGKGIEVYRRVQMRRSVEREHAAASDPNTRVSTGIPGLDELSNGGYLLGSSTMMVGVSGTGKTVMALQYLREGAKRGERGLMITLDEPPDQVVRDASTIGFDLKAALDSGLIRLWYEPPQELQIDRHFAQMEDLMANFKPQRAVFDSLYTYQSSLGVADRDYRDFLRAVVALMKHHHATAVYNHENPEILGMSSMMGNFSCSSLVDNILLMNWVELGDTFRHALTIGKMRAGPMSHVTHECEIVSGQGMRVLPRPIRGILPSRPFSSYAGLISRSPERSPESVAEREQNLT